MPIGRLPLDRTEQQWALTYLGRLIQGLRHAQGLSRADACAAWGLSNNTLAHLESGQGIHLRKLLTIADYFGLSLDTLCGRDRTPALPD